MSESLEITQIIPPSYKKKFRWELTIYNMGTFEVSDVKMTSDTTFRFSLDSNVCPKKFLELMKEQFSNDGKKRAPTVPRMLFVKLQDGEKLPVDYLVVNDGKILNVDFGSFDFNDSSQVMIRIEIKSKSLIKKPISKTQ